MKHFHSEDASDVLDELDVVAPEGLSPGEVPVRRARYGSNQLLQQQREAAIRILVNQFRSLIVGLLLVAMLVSGLTEDWLECIAIGVVIVLNTAIGFVSELRAVRSMEALRRLGESSTTVRRDGELQRIPAAELVPGDIVVLEAGDVVAADLRIIDTSKLQVDESMLTGESIPVDKSSERVDANTPLAERQCMMFKGTAITRGSAECVTCAIGMQTELGRITELVQQHQDEGLTPLEDRLGRLGRKLVWLVLAVAVLVAVTGIMSGKDVYLIAKTSIALAVAAVPEGLPIVATLALTRGMWRMAQRNVLVNRLAAVETLGATTVIFTDKTGTLTENQMTVRRIVLHGEDVEVTGAAFDDEGQFVVDAQGVSIADHGALNALLEVSMLCTNASWHRPDPEQDRAAIGEPMEVALLVAAVKGGLDHNQIHAQFPEVREVAFDPAVNMMATYHALDSGEFRIAVKGAPEAVLDACQAVRTENGDIPLDDEMRRAWFEHNEHMADSGLRILALAEKPAPDSNVTPYADLTLLGLVGLLDPPRADVRSSIQACRDAGVRVIMVTGDQPSTARHVAAAVGLSVEGDMIKGSELPEPEELTPAARNRILRTTIFARTNPKQKLNLIRVFQEQGEIVAMTGDGVNDAPALKTADIGVAMGRRGTDVAREASDMVLRDDAFGSIVVAIAEGRVILDNVRLFIRYLISCNLSEIIVVFLGIVAQTPLPVLPLQILFLNLITDVFPALALGLGEGDPNVMTRPPREPTEPILTRQHWIENAALGVLIAIAVLGALLLCLRWLDFDTDRAVTVSFLTLGFAQLWHVFNMRLPGPNIFLNQVTRNRYVWLALLGCSGLMVASVHVPWLSAPLDTFDPGWQGWSIVGVASLLPTIVTQVALSLRGSETGKRPDSPSSRSVVA